MIAVIVDVQASAQHALEAHAQLSRLSVGRFPCMAFGTGGTSSVSHEPCRDDAANWIRNHFGSRPIRASLPSLVAEGGDVADAE